MADNKFTQLGNLFERTSKIVIDALKKNLEDHNSIASASLLQSIQMPFNIYGSKYTMELKMNDYWKWVDEGRKAGKMPPIEPLFKWIAHKGIDSVNIMTEIRNKKINSKSKKIDRKHLTPTQASKQLAFLIARKIGKSGTEGTNFYSDVINDNFNNQLKLDITKAMKQDIIIIINKGK